MQVTITIDRRSPVPLHRQIYDGWRTGILCGRLRPGDKVPSTRELAEVLEVSRITVTAAYEQLTGEGYLESTRGSGTFVCRQLPEEAFALNKPAAREAATVTFAGLSRYGTRLEAKVARLPDEPDVINLSRLSPALDHFPLRIWRRLITRHLRKVTPTVFDYSEHVAGHQSLRDEIAGYLGRSRGVRCAPDQVVVVNSSQQALDLCARLLIDPGDEVAFENPGYDRARELFAAHGARLRPVRVTARGISIEDLGNTARLAYVTPSHQFPIGVSMSLTRRLELIEWARSRGAALIEDDYDSEFRYSGPPLPALQSLTDRVPIIYVGTFSKVMFPGLRMGYVVVPRELVTAFTRAKRLSDRHTAMLEQAALADFIHEGHLARHIRRMRRLYRMRRDVMIESLARHFGERARVYGDAAGLHMVVGLPRRGIAHGRRNGVELTSAAVYYLSDAPSNEFVMGFSAINERAIREGIKRLAH